MVISIVAVPVEFPIVAVTVYVVFCWGSVGVPEIVNVVRVVLVEDVRPVGRLGEIENVAVLLLVV